MKIIQVMYAVYDKKAKELNGFMLFKNDADALRAWANTCEKNEVFQKWPEDFQFVKLGDLNQEGKFNQENHRIVAEAVNYVKRENAESSQENK